MLREAAEPATKKQKVSPTPLASQDSQSSFADVLARIQIDSQESTSAFLGLDPRRRSLTNTGRVQSPRVELTPGRGLSSDPSSSLGTA